MPVDVARYFLSIDIPAAEKKRYARVAAREQTELSPGERAELENLVQANTVLMLFQAKARLSLSQGQPTS
jgi:hypothetical protein